LRLLLRCRSNLVELALDVADPILARRCEEVGVIPAGRHDADQRAKVVLVLETPPCQLVLTQPNGRRALREGAGQRHGPRQLDDLADGRDDEAVAKGVGKGEDKGDHATRNVTPF
jgi:hypothetical protein